MTSALTRAPAWKRLEAMAGRAGAMDIAALLENEPGRADALILEAGGVLADFSKNAIDARALEALLDLARERDTQGWFDRMLAGGAVNTTENRAAMHTALRAEKPPEIVRRTLARMRQISERVRADSSIRHVVHIGIGGSDLGPRLVCEALSGLHGGPRVHFVANVDPDDLDPLLGGLSPDEVLVTVASKTFTTQETLFNLQAVLKWMGGRADRVVALTANTEGAAALGIASENTLPLWDWVGGRFSVWSAVGLPVALAFGFGVFESLLAGARGADAHAAAAPLGRNIPVLMALLELWYRNVMGCACMAVVPYAHRLALFPAYLQQLAMESNGKGVDRDGRACTYRTAMAVLGQEGTNAQHAFFQMLHQGTDVVPVDFIAVREPGGCPARHKVLLANMLGQARALMLGRKGAPETACPGNRPSTVIVLPRMDAENLGFLLALYEHKTAILGNLWNLNPFDQFGVELGKSVTKELLAPHGDMPQNEMLDFSTNKLIFHTFPAK